jgi:AcrR family transcriptional regulator
MTRVPTAKSSKKILSRRPTPNARARTEEQKKGVREDLLAVGRHLFAAEDPSTVSLRRIATQAGYSPGTVYKYFRDQHDLFIAIREQDMSSVVDSLEKIAERTHDPEERLRAVFLSAVKHWLKYPDQFRVLFSIRPEQSVKEGQQPFGKSAVVLRSYQLYRNLVDALFVTFPAPPCSPRLATDALIAATHGIIAFTLHTHTVEWSNPKQMAEEVLDALLFAWTRRNPRVPAIRK